MRLVRTLERKISSDGFDAGFGQLACWVGSILVLGLGFFKLGSLPLTETELFFGTLLVLSVGLLGVNAGLLLRIDNRTRPQNLD